MDLLEDDVDSCSEFSGEGGDGAVGGIWSVFFGSGDDGKASESSDRGFIVAD